jgi:hypothetical protein
MIQPTTKTGSELEHMILARVCAEMVCPPDLQVRVIGVGGRWHAFAEVIDKDKLSGARGANRLGASLPVRTSRFRGNELPTQGLGPRFCCVGVRCSNARAVRYRRLALAEEDNAKADLLHKLADECDRGLLCTAEWLSVRPSVRNEQPQKQETPRHSLSGTHFNTDVEMRNDNPVLTIPDWTPLPNLRDGRPGSGCD